MAMETLVKETYDKTLYVEEENELVASWGFIGRPAHMIWSSIAYLVIVTLLLPQIMKKRKPLSLRGPIMVYNVFQIIMNSYVLIRYYELFGSQSLRWWENMCCPVSAAQNFRPLVSLEFMEVLKIFYINKLVDLADTIFILLRKKDNQVTFLHVYHHVNMVICTYFSAMVFREEMSMMFATLNSAVHILMYSYYFLAAFGPAVQKYLWWKRYITLIQLIQFIMALIMLLISRFQSCPMDPKFFYLWTLNITIFLGLFVRFYLKSYINKNKIE